MELRHLRYFVAVAEERHFGHAAQRLHMAQPPLSQQIRQLEAELAVELFTRTTRRVELTPAGELFLQRVREILSSIDAAAADVARVADGRIGKLALGFVGSATYELLPALAGALRRDLPAVELELVGELLTSRQLEYLEQGVIDVGFLRPPVRDPQVTLEVIRSEPLAAVLPQRHRLAAEPLVHLADLRDEPFVSYPSDCSVVHDATVDACGRAGYRPVLAHEVRETSTIVSFVAAGLGVSLVPSSVRHLRVAGAVYRPLVETGVEVALAMAYRADDRSPLVRQVLGRVRSFVGGFAATPAMVTETTYVRSHI